MTETVHPLHHKNIRKRIHQKCEQYPHPNKFKRMLDHMIYVVGILGPLMTIPQLQKVWINKDVTGVSIITWGGFAFVAAVWILYGIVHKEKPIIMTQGLWCTMDILMVAGIITYL